MTPEIQKDGEVIFASQETGAAVPIDQDVEKEDFEDEVPGQVAKKWRGTRADQQDMVVLGKKQVLRVCSTIIDKMERITTDWIPCRETLNL